MEQSRIQQQSRCRVGSNTNREHNPSLSDNVQRILLKGIVVSCRNTPKHQPMELMSYRVAVMVRMIWRALMIEKEQMIETELVMDLMKLNTQRT
jgi:hypothetical protein